MLIQDAEATHKLFKSKNKLRRYLYAPVVTISTQTSLLCGGGTVHSLLAVANNWVCLANKVGCLPLQQHRLRHDVVAQNEITIITGC